MQEAFTIKRIHGYGFSFCQLAFIMNAMASSKDYLTYVLDLLREVNGITFKKMMGEYLLYRDGILFGGIYDDRFLIKKTPSVECYGLKEEIPYPSAKPMLLIDIEDSRKIEEIVLAVCCDLS